MFYNPQNPQANIFELMGGRLPAGSQNRAPGGPGNIFSMYAATNPPTKQPPAPGQGQMQQSPISNMLGFAEGGLPPSNDAQSAAANWGGSLDAPPIPAGAFDLGMAPQKEIVSADTEMYDPASKTALPMGEDPRFAGLAGEGDKLGKFDSWVNKNSNMLAAFGNSIATNPFGFGAGVGAAAGALPEAIKADKESRDLDVRKAGQQKLLGAMAKGLKLTPEMLSYFSANPDAADAVIQAWMTKKMRLGTEASFRPMTQAERAAYGISENDSAPYQIDEISGEIKVPGGRGTTVNNNLGGDNSFWKKYDEQYGTNIAETMGAALSADRRLIQIDALESHLSQFESGGMASVKLWLANTYGIPAEGIEDIQAAEALISQLVPGQRPPGSGTMSDADLLLFKASLPSIMNQPGGNQKIIQTMRAIADYDRKRGQIIQRAMAARGSPDEATSVAQMTAELMALENPLAWVKALPGAGAIDPSVVRATEEYAVKSGWVKDPNTGKWVKR